MAMIKDALSALPAKPAMYLAPLLVVLVLTLYYRDQYNKCADIRQSRVEFHELMHSVDSPGQFRLTEFTDFEWNKVRIVASVQPDTINDACPFDWNWSDEERESLIASGHLAALVFGLQGRVVRHLEVNGAEVRFRGTGDNNLTPRSAVFDVSREAGRVTLTLKN
jgi:hypothetical protein